MQLFHSPASPFVRKVMVLLHEAGRADEVEIRGASVTPVSTGDATLMHNPLGKIPTLLREDGPALYDSRVICRYLDDLWGLGLYPQSRIWEVLTLEATADGILDAAVLMVYEARFRDESLRSADWVEGQWGKVTRGLDSLDQLWMSHLAGKPTVCHIGVGCALAYLDFRHPGRDWRTGRAALADWYAGWGARPSMQATRPPES